MKPLRVVAGVALLGTLGCKTVQPIQQPAQFIPQAKPDLVVVVYKDNSQVLVQEPEIAGDTLKGTWAGLGEPVAVPLDQVQRIDARLPNKKRTTMLIAGLGVLTAAGVYMVASGVIGGGKVCDPTYQPPTVAPGRCIGEMGGDM